VAPLCEATKAPRRQAFSKTLRVSVPRVSPTINPAMKASPAPTVSFTPTLGAGAVTSWPRSHKAAPSSASVTQMRVAFVAFAMTGKHP
jgi:hypothetical protein